MHKGTSPATDEDPTLRTAQALIALSAGVLPVWTRHLATSRAQSEVAVSQMLQAFADIGPHINMAQRQSEQINDALAQAIGGVPDLAGACEHLLLPLLGDDGLSAHGKAAIADVLSMVRKTMAALEQVARPFQHETQMVAAQVERMYMGLQYQDRISQMMVLLEADMARLHTALAAEPGSVPDLGTWLGQLQSQYAMADQRQSHGGTVVADGETDSNETTFF
ncbi:MAG: hypothetical protein K9K38_09790 [Rhodoferax sp.]|nr:hypothetical protein [Rhodoferax sp.]